MPKDFNEDPALALPPNPTQGIVSVGPGMETLDVSVVRGFALSEALRLETRGEFFNALNHTNLGTPNRFVNTAGFGSITEVTTPGREIQVSARLSF